jgi:8-hydroxy-5-deazaflavin:NADPH oxidoreductase
VRIGVLGGTGPAGQALAARLASVGHEVVIGSRTKERAVDISDELVARWDGHDLRLEGGDNAGAADTELVVVATPWEGAAATTATVAHLLEGKILVCMANALERVNGEFQALIPPRGSVAVHVAAAAPHARVVAAFQHVPAKELAAIDQPVHSDVLVCSDDRSATAAVIELIAPIPGMRGFDAGSLSSAAPVEALTAVLLQLNSRYRCRVSLHLSGID